MPTPVHVVSGFQGAGKSTFINHVLERAPAHLPNGHCFSRHFGFYRRVGSHCNGMPSGGLDGPDHRPGGLVILPVIYAHGVAPLGRQARRGRADAAATAGDDDYRAHGCPFGISCFTGTGPFCL